MLVATQIMLIGGFTGLMSGCLGVRGGLLLIPLLFLIHVSMHHAVGFSLTYMLLTSASGVHRHWRQRTLDAYLGLAMAIPSHAAATMGGGPLVEHGWRPPL